MRNKSLETLAMEWIIRVVATILLVGIVVDAATSQNYGAEAVNVNTFQIETSKGMVTALNSGTNEVLVKYSGKAREIALAGLDRSAERVEDQFGILVLMSYDAGGHYEYKKAYQIFMSECGCKDQPQKINREYFNLAWGVRKQMLKVLPSEVLDELGGRMLRLGGNEIVRR